MASPLDIATAPLREAGRIARRASRSVIGRSLESAVEGRTVLVTGSSSGIGRATALKIADAGGIPLLVARREEELSAVRDQIAGRGGEAFVYPGDLSDPAAVEELVERVLAEQERIHYLVNNAGRSIRRSIDRSLDRFHDYERTIQLNYLGAIKLTMSLIPQWKEVGGGHVTNVSTMGTQVHTPRFSAYLASKAALEEWTTIAAAELARHRITFTTVHMPLVRTEMIEPTEMYRSMPAISPEKAADMVCEGIRNRPLRVSTSAGSVFGAAAALTPQINREIIKRGYAAFPESGAARGEDESDNGSRGLSTAQKRLAAAMRFFNR
jgi:NAD(P)-dependent dehydrogenase (short-subunit alcohol dehydrogenase family)